MPQFFTNPALAPSICEGPLGSIVPAYADLLYQQGYTHQSAHLQLRFLADLSRWLDRQRFPITDITKALLRRYLRSRHHRFRPRRDDASILGRVLHLLHTKGLRKGSGLVFCYLPAVVLLALNDGSSSRITI